MEDSPETEVPQEGGATRREADEERDSRKREERRRELMARLDSEVDAILEKEEREAAQGVGEDEECRICRGGSDTGPLLHPCKCAGSIRYVHQECLDEWLSRTNSVRCELCHQPFLFSPVYVPNTPDVLSVSQFLVGVLNIGAKKLVLVLRVMTVIFLWILCLPIGTSWICRLYFLRSLNGLSRFQQGVLLSLLVVTVFLAVSGLRDYMMRQERQEQHQHQQQQRQQRARNPRREAADAVRGGGGGGGEGGGAGRAAAARQDASEHDGGVVGDAGNRNPPSYELLRMRGEEAQSARQTTQLHEPNGVAGIDPVEEPGPEGIRASVIIPGDVTELDIGLSRKKAAKGWEEDGWLDADDTNVIAAQELEDEEPARYGQDDVDRDLLRLQEHLRVQQEREEEQERETERRELEALAAERERNAAFNAAPIAARAMEAAAVQDRQMDAAVDEEQRVQDMHADADDMLLGFLDAREEEVPLDEFVGLHGPIRVMVENVLTALISNALSIGSLTLMPFTLGRLVLWLKHNWYLLLPGRAAGRGAGLGGREAYYSDWVTLMIGYATLLVLTLKVVLLSLVLGKRQQQSLLVRQVLTVLGYAWIMCKVSVLLLIELVAFPTGCGWWLDMCSLHVLDATGAQRMAFHRSHVLVSHLVHWVLGVAFMIHVAVLVAVLREVVKPQVLWFLRNPEEAIEHPLRDLIDEPVPKHARRITLCLILYLPLTLVLVYLPVTAAKLLAPAGMFPLHVSLDTISDVPVPVLLLHVSLPLIMEHFRPRNSFKQMLESWIEIVGTWLGLRDSLLPRHEENDSAIASPRNPPGIPSTNGSGGYVADDEGPDSPGVVHPDWSQGWRRRRAPKKTGSRLLKGIFMMALAWFSIALIGAAVIVASLTVGRWLLRVLVSVHVKHDVYAFGMGFCVCSTAFEMGSHLIQRIRTQPASEIVQSIGLRATQGAKCAVAVILMGGFVAGLLGVLLDLVLVVPLRVSSHQSPELFGVGQWMGGVLSLKLGCRILTDTPSLAPLAPRLRHALIEMSQRGWQNLYLLELMEKVALPIITHLVLLLAVPYLLAWGVTPHFGAGEKACIAFWRWSYPVVFYTLFSFWLIQRAGHAMSQVHNALRDSLYLVGRRLHNLPSPS